MTGQKTVKVGLIQMAVGPDPEENLRAAAGQVEETARAGAHVICLPELFRHRYFPQHIGMDIVHIAETVPGDSTDVLARIARKYEVVIIVPVLEKSPDGRIYNSAVIIDADATVHSPYRKIHIPQDPGFFEKEYFYPGDAYRVISTRYGRIAVLICYDQWFPEAARCVALDGAQIIFYPTAIGHPGGNEPVEGDWQEAWELIQKSHAIANSVHVAALNRVGQEDTTRFFGGSFICDAFGKIIAHAGDTEEVLVAPVDLEMNHSVMESWGFFRNRRPDTYTRITVPFVGKSGANPAIREGDTPRNRGFHMPAEWEPHDAVWISWPHSSKTFPHLGSVEDSYVKLIAALSKSERVDLFVPTTDVQRKVREKLNDSDGDLSNVSFRTTKYADVWIRDYGPTFVVNRALRQLAMVRWEFNAWGGKYDSHLSDGKIPQVINKKFNLPMFSPGIVLEGGSIDVNGHGTVLTTRACLLNPNRNPSLSAPEIEDRLKEYLGVEKVIWLNEGIEGDDTDGHIDDIARFVGPSTVVCAYETNAEDVNHPALHENYQILRRSSDQDGTPLTVIKLPMPAPVMDKDQRYPASYTNFFIGNRVVIVPIFGDHHDGKALKILQGVFPGRKVIGIDARAMVEGFGTFHCGTQQQPRL